MTLHTSTTSLTARNSLTLRNAAVLCEAPTASSEAAQIVDSTSLLRSQQAVGISHNDAVYRLQSTKLGKLILSK